jgi:hypothetical protein
MAIGFHQDADAGGVEAGVAIRDPEEAQPGGTDIVGIQGIDEHRPGVRQGCQRRRTAGWIVVVVEENGGFAGKLHIGQAQPVPQFVG